ncbi:MAG TPA: hypothetical protein VF614_06175 [Chthoniobacteraceae bacterium]|jgi:hypothetical protein
MRVLLYLLLGLLVWCGVVVYRNLQQCKSPRERAFIVRASTFCGLLGMAVLLVLVVLPMQLKLLALVPAFAVAVSVAKGWKSVRTRLRNEAEGRVDMDRMKRVN